MLNQVSVEAVYSATYVENYLDCVENLPNDLQRLISRMRELDVNYLGKSLSSAVFINYIFDYRMSCSSREGSRSPNKIMQEHRQRQPDKEGPQLCPNAAGSHSCTRIRRRKNEPSAVNTGKNRK